MWLLALYITVQLQKMEACRGLWERPSSVGVLTTARDEQPKDFCSISKRARDFLFLQSVQKSRRNLKGEGANAPLNIFSS